jgi:hypothetical protein
MADLEGDIPVNPGDIVTGTHGPYVVFRFAFGTEDGESGCQQWLWAPAKAREIAASIAEMADLAEQRGDAHG